MARLNHRDPIRPAPSLAAQPSEESQQDDALELNDFEEEMKRLCAANQQLMHELHSEEEQSPPTPPPLSPAEDLTMLRLENAELKARVHELEVLAQSSTGQSEDVWFER